jgi:hypothetical protein
LFEKEPEFEELEDIKFMEDLSDDNVEFEDRGLGVDKSDKLDSSSSSILKSFVIFFLKIFLIKQSYIPLNSQQRFMHAAFVSIF